MNRRLMSIHIAMTNFKSGLDFIYYLFLLSAA